MAPFEASRVRPSPRRTLPPSRALLAVGLLASYAAMWVVMKVRAGRLGGRTRPEAAGS